MTCYSPIATSLQNLDNRLRQRFEDGQQGCEEIIEEVKNTFNKFSSHASEWAAMSRVILEEHHCLDLESWSNKRRYNQAADTVSSKWVQALITVRDKWSWDIVVEQRWLESNLSFQDSLRWVSIRFSWFMTARIVNVELWSQQSLWCHFHESRGKITSQHLKWVKNWFEDRCRVLGYKSQMNRKNQITWLNDLLPDQKKRIKVAEREMRANRAKFDRNYLFIANSHDKETEGSEDDNARYWAAVAETSHVQTEPCVTFTTRSDDGPVYGQGGIRVSHRVRTPSLLEVEDQGVEDVGSFHHHNHQGEAEVAAEHTETITMERPSRVESQPARVRSDGPRAPSEPHSLHSFSGSIPIEEHHDVHLSHDSHDVYLEESLDRNIDHRSTMKSWPSPSNAERGVIMGEKSTNQNQSCCTCSSLEQKLYQSTTRERGLQGELRLYRERDEQVRSTVQSGLWRQKQTLNRLRNAYWRTPHAYSQKLQEQKSRIAALHQENTQLRCSDTMQRRRLIRLQQQIESLESDARANFSAMEQKEKEYHSRAEQKQLDMQRRCDDIIREKEAESQSQCRQHVQQLHDLLQAHRHLEDKYEACEQTIKIKDVEMRDKIAESAKLRGQLDDARNLMSENVKDCDVMEQTFDILSNSVQYYRVKPLS